MEGREGGERGTTGVDGLKEWGGGRRAAGRVGLLAERESSKLLQGQPIKKWVESPARAPKPGPAARARPRTRPLPAPAP